MKSLLFTAILSLRKRLEQILIKFAILLQVRLTHAQTFFRGVPSINLRHAKTAHAQYLKSHTSKGEHQKTMPQSSLAPPPMPVNCCQGL
jgi:hypothetical protein